MEATMVSPSVRKVRSVSALGKLATVSLVLLAILLVALQIFLIGELIPPLTVFALLGLLFAAMVMRGWRWAPVLATLLSAAMLAMFGVPIIAAASYPAGSFPMFALIAVLLPSALVGIVAGIAATVQNYRHPAELRRAPRGLAYVLTALVALVAGGILVAAIPSPDATAGINPEALSGLPVLATKNFEFEQKEIRAKVGETVTLKLTNADPEAHFLDIDELNVHAPIPAGKMGLAVFKPTEPGIYTFYCRPHADKESGEGMVGKLIVE